VLIVIAAVVVVVIIPVPVGMPAMAVFIPPPVGVSPAVLARFVQLLARVYHLSAFPAVVFGSLVQPVIGFCDASLARRFIGANCRCTHENKSTCQRHCRKPRLYPNRYFRLVLHSCFALLMIDCGPV
jgi:hypothetical protein